MLFQKLQRPAPLTLYRDDIPFLVQGLGQKTLGEAVVVKNQQVGGSRIRQSLLSIRRSRGVLT